MLGAGVGVGALLLVALDPTLIAHGPLVTTDVGCAAFATLFVFLLWRVLAVPTRGRLLLAGLALGAALAAKFSAVLLLSMGGLLLLIGAPRVGVRRLVWATGVLLALGVVAAVVVQATYFFPRDPWLYLGGIRSINADHDPAYRAYMAGRFSPKFWTYYLVTYALKEPLPSMALAAVGAWTLARPARALPVDRAFVLLPPALVFAGYTVFSDNLGVRYLIPALPFLHLLGGVGLVTLLESGRRARAVGLLLVVWLVVAAAGIFPITSRTSTRWRARRPMRAGSVSTGARAAARSGWTTATWTGDRASTSSPPGSPRTRAPSACASPTSAACRPSASACATRRWTRAW
jgi:4-amino-4-deoxy-L-arabinose transferase-like glycosyltransferase